MSGQGYDWVGQDVERVDAVDKVTGAARYTADLKFPRLLHAAVVRSSLPHARLLHVDLGPALSVPGVKAAVCGRDVPFHVGIYLKDQTVFACDRVRYVGDPVAAVAAESPEAAAEAASRIAIDYEPLEPVFDVERGLEPDAPRVHPELGRYECVPWITPEPGTNVCNHLKVRKGDFDAALKRCAHVIENRFAVPQVQHVPLEPHVSVARVDLAGRVEIHTSAQSPFTVRHLLCACFGFKHADVRVIVPHVGGGFGGKAGINLEPIATALALRCDGRPVRVAVDRSEEFYAVVVRQGLQASLTSGVDENGRVIAQKMRYVWDCGAYGGYGVNVVRAAGYTCGGAYAFDHVQGDSIGVYTNRPIGSAYRGFGMQEIHWALESQMDAVAREIGMDPVEFRLRNCLGPGKATVTGQVLDESAGDVATCIRKVACGIGLDVDRTDPSGGGPIRRGRGMACAVKAPAMPNDAASSVILKFCEDATLELSLSGVDIGQGLRTVAAQYAAQALKLPIESVRVHNLPDTHLSPYDWQTVASRQTWATGNAVLRAAEDCKRQLLETAASALGRPADALELDAGCVRDPDSGRSVPLDRLVMGYLFEDGHAVGGPVAACAHFVPEGLLFLDPETSQSKKPVAKWTFGAQGVEISVDTRTGEIRVDRVVACYDVGKVVHPSLIRGQTFGGIVQGLGTGLMEELVLDRTSGRIANATLADYKIPSSLDAPRMEAGFLETPQADGPLGARGVGEHTMIPTPAAIANALVDACGVRVHSMPLTAEKVLAALDAREAGREGGHRGS
ncbi:MAG: xanthine dehydrogenase family protein molybdopterin-binding subunit [Deltaproteobacteria bacterium]|nr:xanthine dehydrogenase family protein molybdopterin-binding subunit [Deltaproteobacteria bacterium]